MDKLKKHLPLISAILAVLAFAMIIVPVIVNYYDVACDATYMFNGFQSIFGTKVEYYGSNHVLRFSFWNFVAYLLVIAAAVIGFTSKKRLNPKFGILSSICGLASGVIFFLVLNTTTFAVQGAQGYSIGPGAIIGGAFAILSAVAILIASINQIKENKKPKQAEAEETAEAVNE